MKHFPSIMFHPGRQSLIFRYLHSSLIGIILILLNSVTVKAQEPLPYATWFNPEKGFKPVQPNLSKVFLQIAGSLEHFGTPIPYVRHIIAEHARIDAKHLARGGKGSSRPAYLTDEYVDQLIANWNKISPPLKLDVFCREAGRNIRYAILGSKNMSVAELVNLEGGLGESERKTYRNLLEKPYFTKADMPEVNAFYGIPYDKLSEIGKDQMSRRTWLATQPPDVRKKQMLAALAGTSLVHLFNEHQDKTVAFLEDRSKPKATADTLQSELMESLKLDKELEYPKGLPAFDAEPLIYSHKIRSEYMRRVEAVRKQIQPEKEAVVIEKAMRLILENLVVLAQSEFEAALYDKVSNSKAE